MPNFAVLADSRQFGGTLAHSVPIACTGSTTSNSQIIAGDPLNSIAIIVASTTNFNPGQGVIIDNAGPYPESATILSILGPVMVFTQQLKYTHVGTYNVTGATVALAYTCAFGKGDLVTTINLFRSGSVGNEAFFLFKFNPGYLLTDYGYSNIVYEFDWPTITPPASFQTATLGLVLLPGQQLAWYSSAANKIAGTIMGIQDYLSAPIQPQAFA